MGGRCGWGLVYAGMAAHPAVPRHLLDFLSSQNGLSPLLAVDVGESERAAKIFRREGFVVVLGALCGEALERLRAGCASVVADIERHDPCGLGNRGFKRYSFGSCSSTRHQIHRPEWAALLDSSVVSDVLYAIWGDGCACIGGGGDVVASGCVEHQTLHSDCGHEEGLLACEVAPYIAVNFLMQDQTPFNGPLRQIPRSQHTSQLEAPAPWGEGQETLLSTICPAPAGTAVFRDLRCWHGGTPNLSMSWRALPNVEFIAPFLRDSFGDLPKTMPYEVWEGLSARGRRFAQHIVADPREKIEATVEFWPGLGRHCFMRPAEVVPLFECCRPVFERWHGFERVD